MNLVQNLGSWEDKDIVRVALGGSEAEKDAAFEELFHRHYRSVAQVAFAVSGSTASLEDVVQSTFMAAFCSLHKLRDPARFKYWLRAIAANEARSSFASQPRLDSISVTPELLIMPEASAAMENAYLVERVLGDLPQAYAAVLYLRYYQDYSVRQTAEILGISEGLVKWRTNRAKLMAARILEQLQMGG